VHFVRQGRGSPALVFVHGFACSHEDWRHQLEFFKAKHEVVACDLRGHGETPGKPHECTIEHYGGDVAALVSNLDLGKVILIGHSMGCRVVLEANRIASERIAGLVLIDGSRQPGIPPPIEDYPAFAENLFRQMFFKTTPQSEAIVARAVSSSRDFGPHLWPAMARWDVHEMEPALAAVRCPLLAIQSTTRGADLRRSPMKPGDTNPYLDLVKSKGARVEIVPDTGHFTMLEAPDAVNRLIAGFCR
jgi:pimeloyl-ACP methyl ester carboxylesterase